jgi:CHAT domain-containing protein
MNGKFFIIGLGLMLGVSTARSQCIERDTLRKQLAYLQETTAFSDAQKLTMLLNYVPRLKACTYRDDSIHCSLLSAIALMYQNQSDHFNAIHYYKQAIELASGRTGTEAVPARNLVEYYSNLSDSYDSLNKVPERLACLDSAIAIGIRSPSMSRLSLWCMHSKVLYYFDVGDYRRCIEYANTCERFGKQYANSPAEQVKPGGMVYAAVSVLWRVNALIFLKRFADAEALMLNRLPEYRKLSHKDDLAAVNLGVLYDQLGQIAVHNKNYDRALFYFREAYAVERAAGNSIMCRMILNDIGYFVYYLDNRNIDSSLIYYHRSLQVKVDTASLSKFYPYASSHELVVVETLNVFSSAADAFIRKGWFDSAYIYVQLGFDQIEPGFNEEKIMKWSQSKLGKLSKIRYLVSLFMSKGTAYHENYKHTGNIVALREALRVYKLTDELLDRIKAAQFDDDSKLYWRSDSRRIYEQAIQASFSLGDVDAAFYFFEKSRAVLLNDQLKEQRWASEKEIVRQNQLRSRINFLQNEVARNDNDAARLDKLQKELFSSRQEFDGLAQAIKIKDPLYYQNFIDSGIITLPAVRNQVLNNHTALIELYAGDSAVYELVVTKQKNYFKTINKHDFDDLSAQYLSYLSDPGAANVHFNEFAKVSQKLYRLLFDGVDRQNGRIIVSPDGHYFPFEALITSFDKGVARYLVHDFAVTYVYSARYLANYFAQENIDDSKKIIGFAPVAFTGTGLADLPGSDISLKKITSDFNGSACLLNHEASKGNFLQRFHSYELIQLYTHATDSGYNGEPVIWFADSALTLSDLISEYRPATRLIVLSACETAKGKLYEGEGIFSFNRGFAALGIPSSVSNLWAVDNQSSYKITELFYKYLQNGMSSDVALQKAKLDFISSGDKEKQIPYYWAAPIFVGIDESFGSGTGTNVNTWIMIAALATVAAGIIILLRRKLRNPNRT